MLTARLNVASVHLCFICLALSSKLSKNICSLDTISVVDSVISSSNLTSVDCRLYTPTTENYLACPSDVMKCFADEFQVLDHEWDAIPPDGVKLKTMLRRLAQKLSKNLTEFKCFQCELSSVQRADRFIKGLHSVLTAMCSNSSTSQPQVFLERKDGTEWKKQRSNLR